MLKHLTILLLFPILCQGQKYKEFKDKLGLFTIVNSVWLVNDSTVRFDTVKFFNYKVIGYDTLEIRFLGVDTIPRYDSMGRELRYYLDTDFYDHFYNYMESYFDDFEWNFDKDLNVFVKPKNEL